MYVQHSFVSYRGYHSGPSYCTTRELSLNTLTQTCLIFREHYEFMIDIHSYTHNLSSLGLNGIRTHDLYHTGAVPLPLPTELSSHLGAGHFVSL